MTYQLTKAQAVKFAEGFNMYVERHNQGLASFPKSPKGAWIARGYEEVRSQMIARQTAAGASVESIMAPMSTIVPAEAQGVWDAADARLAAIIESRRSFYK